MRTQDSRAIYETRLHKVLEYIDRRLDQPLNLARIARVAHFSPFHFHRLFTALMGETLGEYARRRRLEIAAVALVTQANASILDVALSVGFGSAEAFTHAFKRRYAVSPTAWRRQQRVHHSKADQMDRKTDQVRRRTPAQSDGARRPKPEAAMTVVAVDRPPTLIAYLRHVGPYGAPINHFWQTRVYPWMLSNNLLGQPRYGISHDDPGVTEASKCRYDAGVEICSGFKSIGSAFTTTLPGGRYASTHFKGTVTDIEAAWMRLLRDWLPSSGLKMDARPAFEFYPPGSSFDPDTGVFDCQICIPVVSL